MATVIVYMCYIFKVMNEFIFLKVAEFSEMNWIAASISISLFSSLPHSSACLLGMHH